MNKYSQVSNIYSQGIFTEGYQCRDIGPEFLSTSLILNYRGF